MMKKVLFVLALVFAYGISTAVTSSDVVLHDDAEVTIVASADESSDMVTKKRPNPASV